MCLLRRVDVLKVVDLHIESLLILHDTFHLLDQSIARLLVFVDLGEHDVDGLLLVEILGLVDLVLEGKSLFLELGHL